MKQVVRRVLDAKGKIRVEEVAAPACDDHSIVIDVRRTLISSGTERATLQKNPVELTKLVMSDPWMRKAVFAMMAGGLRQTAEKVIDELTLLREIGYSGAGVALETGKKTRDIQPGQRVAYAFAGHCEYVKVSRNFTVPIPEGVSFDQACFSTVGAIALQGVRKSGARLGEKIAVIGLGLLGQLTAQLLLAAGCDVIGIDLSNDKLQSAERAGVRHLVNSSTTDPVQAVKDITGGRGADRVLICAQTQDPTPANQALNMCRKQGQVTFVGIVKMDLERMPFFKGELNLNFSRAYGPGVMDPEFERGEIDYPDQYVRFTARDNMADFMHQIALGKVNVDPFITASYGIEQAQEAYDRIFTPGQPAVAVLLTYPEGNQESLNAQRRLATSKAGASQKSGVVNIGLIGCGNFTRSFHLPNMARNPDCRPYACATRSGATGKHVAERFAMEYSSGDAQQIINDPKVELVYIGTRHNLHADLTASALQAGKHVLCEKPVAMTEADLDRVLDAQRESGKLLSVGYNRRYAPLSARLKSALPASPKMIQYTVNSGRIPKDHWTLDPVEGGGRLIGECDHFFDWMHFIAGSPPEQVLAACWLRPNEPQYACVNFSVTLRFANGSLGTLMYTDQGGASFPREQALVHCDGSTWQLDDFQRLYRLTGKRKLVAKGTSRGYAEELKAVLAGVRGKAPPELVQVADVEAATRCCQWALKRLMGE